MDEKTDVKKVVPPTKEKKEKRKRNTVTGDRVSLVRNRLMRCEKLMASIVTTSRYMTSDQKKDVIPAIKRINTGSSNLISLLEKAQADSLFTVEPTP